MHFLDRWVQLVFVILIKNIFKLAASTEKRSWTRLRREWRAQAFALIVTHNISYAFCYAFLRELVSHWPSSRNSLVSLIHFNSLSSSHLQLHSRLESFIFSHDSQWLFTWSVFSSSPLVHSLEFGSKQVSGHIFMVLVQCLPFRDRIK